MPQGRKPRRQESALYLQLLVDSDIHLPVFRSADLHRWITVKSPAVKTRYRLVTATTLTVREGGDAFYFFLASDAREWDYQSKLNRR